MRIVLHGETGDGRGKGRRYRGRGRGRGRREEVGEEGEEKRKGRSGEEKGGKEGNERRERIKRRTQFHKYTIFLQTNLTSTSESMGRAGFFLLGVSKSF